MAFVMTPLLVWVAGGGDDEDDLYRWIGGSIREVCFLSFSGKVAL